jgi:hypothetical protein
MKDRRVAVIGEEYLSSGRLLVEINEIEPDWFASSGSCGPWYRWSPLAVPLTRAGTGDYWVGDLARGVWQVPDSCRWEKVVSFRGASLADVEAHGRGPEPLIVDAGTYGVRVRECTVPMTLDVRASQSMGST